MIAMGSQRATQAQTAEATFHTSPSAPTKAPSTCATAQSVLQLQQTIGNQAVQRLLRAGKLQAKLAISQPDDAYEQEAERVAEQVMRMPEPTLQRALSLIHI